MVFDDMSSVGLAVSRLTLLLPYEDISCVGLYEENPFDGLLASLLYLLVSEQVESLGAGLLVSLRGMFVTPDAEVELTYVLAVLPSLVKLDCLLYDKPGFLSSRVKLDCLT